MTKWIIAILTVWATIVSLALGFKAGWTLGVREGRRIERLKETNCERATSEALL